MNGNATGKEAAYSRECEIELPGYPRIRREGGGRRFICITGGNRKAERNIDGDFGIGWPEKGRPPKILYR